MTEPSQISSIGAWTLYGQFLKEGLRTGFRDRYDIWDKKFETYAQFGAVFGGFPEDLAAKVIAALDRSPLDPVTSDGALPQYDRTALSDELVADVNRGTTFYRPSAEALWWLGDLAELLAEQVAAFMGSPWRILCTRAWKSTASSGGEGANAWHVDGLPAPIAKIMIYPHAVGPELGTVALRFPDGQTLAVENDGPTWVLFKSSEVEHRGVRPRGDAERYAAEFTIVASPRFGLTPIFAGNNARHPHMPWLRGAEYRV